MRKNLWVIESRPSPFKAKIQSHLSTDKVFMAIELLVYSRASPVQTEDSITSFDWEGVYGDSPLSMCFTTRVTYSLGLT